MQAEWQEAHHTGAPFGDLRRTWRKEHCATLNPYGSAGCPYEPKDCALAFLSATQSVCSPGIRKPAAYFRSVAKSTAISRADNKPLARERMLETDVLPKAKPEAKEPRRQEGRSGQGVRGPDGDPARPMVGVAGEREIPGLFALDGEQRKSLYRSRSRPSSIGSLLGKDHSRTREGPAPSRQEGEE